MNLSNPAKFIVRNYECDPYGHLATANYLKYIIEVDELFMDGIGVGQDELNTHDLEWQPQSQFLEFLAPVTVGDHVEVVSSLVDVGKIAEDRLYEINRAGDERLSAIVELEWYLVDKRSGSASHLPEELVETIEKSLPGKKSPSKVQAAPVLPGKPPGVYSMERQVEWHDVDPAYRLSCGALIEYIIDCSVRVGNAFGWSVERSQKEGIAYVVRRLWIEYHGRAALGNQVAVSTWISPPKRSTINRHYILGNLDSGEQIATAHILYVCVDSRTGRPIRQPLDWLEDFRSQISDHGPVS